jgi:chemosensory pili system protein ChpA (sensor histidine kinase/response regulator)
MSDSQDHSKLRWIKGELDATIEQVHADLERYMEGDEDASLMEGCVAKLHQVYGTLQMVQAYGAAMLAEEMELVIKDKYVMRLDFGRQEA